MPADRTVLRDYLREAGGQPITTLVDYQGTGDGTGFGYRIGDRIVSVNNDIISAITGLPAQMRDNWRILTDPKQRGLLARAVVDDSLLTANRRKALFSILLWTTLLIWLVAGVVVGIVNKDALGTYQSGWALFFYSLGTSLFLPTPFEILLGNAVENLGVVTTVAIAAFAKTAGVWLVFLMGDKANEGLRSLTEKRAWARALIGAMERFARRFGMFAIFIILAIPFMSDTAPLFLFAILNIPKGPALAVSFVAIVVRSLLFIYAGDAFASIF